MDATEIQMIIRYTTTVEDMVVFNQYSQRVSPNAKKAQNRVRWIVLPLVAGSFAVTFYQFRADWVWFALPASLVLLAFMFSTSNALAGRVRKLYSQPDLASTLGEKVSALEGEWLSQDSASQRFALHLPSAWKIRLEADVLMVWITSHNGIVLPRRRVIEGDFERLVETLRTGWPEKWDDSPDPGPKRQNENPYASEANPK